MKPLMLVHAVLALALAPALSCAQWHAPPAEPRQGSVHTPHVALVQADDAHHPDFPPAAPSRSWPDRTLVGASTEALMRAQADGMDAGPPLPTLGAAAGLSYQRYLKSFTDPLPASFKKTVETSR